MSERIDLEAMSKDMDAALTEIAAAAREEAIEEAARVADEFKDGYEAIRLSCPLGSADRLEAMAQWVAAYSIGNRLRALKAAPPPQRMEG